MNMKGKITNSLANHSKMQPPTIIVALLYTCKTHSNT